MRATRTTSPLAGAAVTAQAGSIGAGSAMPVELDPDSRRWLSQLRPGHPRHDQTVSRLHDVLRRVACCELSRRRHQLGSVSGPEFDDLSQQAADDALVNILNKLDDLAWEQLPDPLATRPEDQLEQRAQIDALSVAIGELTERQREVFVAIALNDVPIDVLAVKLGTKRNAIYKNLFDARRGLRARMAAAGHPVGRADRQNIPASGNARPGASPACSS